MPSPEPSQVEVVYACSDVQHLAVVEFATGMKVADAVQRSGLLEKFPEINVAGCRFGIFGQTVTADQVLRNGDRVEIYRSLMVDPKAARRERARTQR